MLEKICPVHNVPVYGDKCIKDGCEARLNCFPSSRQSKKQKLFLPPDAKNWW